MTGKIFGTMAIILAMVPFQPAAAADLRVPQDHQTISAALQSAQVGDRVLVAPGTYHEWDLELPSGVTLAGSGEAPSDVVIDGGGNGRILACENIQIAAAVYNLTLTGGRASGGTLYESNGGAIICNYSNLTLQDLIFEDNWADHNGGAIWIFESSPQIVNCRFLSNHAVAGGGAIDCTFRASPLIQDSWFEYNTADWGGGLSCRDYSSPNIVGSVFRGNVAGGEHGYGGGVFSDLDSQPRLAICTLTENAALYGGAVASFVNSGATISRCTLASNVSTRYGGGVYSFDSVPVITASIVAFHNGTGVYSGGRVGPILSLSNLFQNTAGDWVGNAAPTGPDENNFSLDPLFCSPNETQPLGFNLQENSPCHPDSNAGVTVGAWPVGCDSALPLLYDFDAEWNVDHALLSWQIPANLGYDPVFRLTGARVAEPDFEWEVTFTNLGEGQYEATDLDAAGHGEGPFLFRLYISMDDGPWTLLNQVELASLPVLSGIRDLVAVPNPFNPATTISFRLGREQHMKVAIYDLTGRRVKMLAERVFTVGGHEIPWNGRGDSDSALASGAYVVLVEGRDQKLTQKITLLK